ncbi:hypothetical protein D2E25_1852 [Bifidobacterium goeldii]|uniref:Uncharacterized protein n=1 Tax=Bifidobacterium goeldii TaxID=2306975 RepID=A0A430FEN9_9BIFI|nr:hypothetical protein D2E25_1852 [Bifidobacterium goeldii]
MALGTRKRVKETKDHGGLLADRIGIMIVPQWE